MTYWWARRDLNPQPRDYESPALTVELQARIVPNKSIAFRCKLQSTEHGGKKPPSRGSAVAQTLSRANLTIPQIRSQSFSDMLSRTC